MPTMCHIGLVESSGPFYAQFWSFHWILKFRFVWHLHMHASRQWAICLDIVCSYIKAWIWARCTERSNKMCRFAGLTRKMGSTQRIAKRQFGNSVSNWIIFWSFWNPTLKEWVSGTRWTHGQALSALQCETIDWMGRVNVKSVVLHPLDKSTGKGEQGMLCLVSWGERSIVG